MVCTQDIILGVIGQVRVAYVLLAGVLIGAQIFWPPPVGLANNGDFSKVSGYYDLGLGNGGQDEYKAFVTDYIFSPQFHWASRIFSSEHVFVWPAVRVSRALKSVEHFDIRTLGSFHLAALLVAFAGAGMVFSGMRRWVGVTLACFTLFVFTDVAYSSSLNSFYTDTASMLFVLLTIVAAVACPATAKGNGWGIFCLALAGVLLITSKMQHAVLGIPLCLLAIVNAVQSTKRMRAVWVGLGFMWLLTMAFMTQSSDPEYKTPPLFTTIFYKIGGSSTDAARDFQELGLGPEYVPLKGVFAYAANSPMEDRTWRKAFLQRTGYGRVVRFYLRHPQRALGFVWTDLQVYGSLNPDPGLVRNGRPYFSFWHRWRSYLFTKFPGHIVWVFGISLAFCAACCVAPAMRERYPAWLCFLMVVWMALLALAVATLADAADTSRHLFIFHVLTDVVLCFWAWALVDSYAIRRAFSGLRPRRSGLAPPRSTR